tara:strand:+ start:170 stop:673 length:504 start_codon:yes stop_codon:yes gene_type:complete
MKVSNVVRKAQKMTLEGRPISKVDWSNSPYLPTKLEGKNAVGDFGENLIYSIYEERGIECEIIKKGYDVLVGDKKVEVKTSFQNKSKAFFFNQIKEVDEETGKLKDWDHLAFVFVRPQSIEVWECKKPEKLHEHFTKNNGWAWRKLSSDSLCKKTWVRTYLEINDDE